MFCLHGSPLVQPPVAACRTYYLPSFCNLCSTVQHRWVYSKAVPIMVQAAALKLLHAACLALNGLSIGPLPDQLAVEASTKCVSLPARHYAAAGRVQYHQATCSNSSVETPMQGSQSFLTEFKSTALIGL